MIDYQVVSRASVTREPFEFFSTPGVLAADDLAAIAADFPAIHKAGLFPLGELEYGPAFARLIDAVRSPELESVMAEKFAVDLTDKPLMITVRGVCQRKDGRIHTDSVDKIVTCLLYLNQGWDTAGGRLRLLRSGKDLDDPIVEIPPDGGTLVAFKRSERSWHGHAPFEGPRRYVMFNWVRSDAALTREIGRHRLSAKLKRLNPFG